MSRRIVLLMIFAIILPTLAGCSLYKAPEKTSATTQDPAHPIELTIPTSDPQLFVYTKLEADQVYLIDLNNDGKKDTLECQTDKNNSGQRETTVIVNGSSIISEVSNWGGIYLVDLDKNDGCLDLAIQHLGELTWAQTAFICYDGGRMNGMYLTVSYLHHKVWSA